MQDDERDDDADDEEGRRDEGRGSEALYRKEGDRVVPAPADGREYIYTRERWYEDGRAVGARPRPPAAQRVEDMGLRREPLRRAIHVRLNSDFTSDRQISQREMQRARRQQRASRRRDATTADVRVVVLYVAAVPVVLFVVTKLALGL